MTVQLIVPAQHALSVREYDEFTVIEPRSAPVLIETLPLPAPLMLR